VTGLKLNLGCGANHFLGYINVDKYGSPDIRHDLETFPWPWTDNSVSEITLVHVLEHLGQQTDVYLRIMQEMYRICHGRGPHPHHRAHLPPRQFLRRSDPRAGRHAFGSGLFSQKLNREWIAVGAANSPLGVYLELTSRSWRPNSIPAKPGSAPSEPQVDLNLLLRESELYNNLIQQMRFTLRVVK